MGKALNWFAAFGIVLASAGTVSNASADLDPKVAPEMVFRGPGGQKALLDPRAWLKYGTYELPDLKKFYDELSKAMRIGRPGLSELRWRGIYNEKFSFKLGDIEFIAKMDPTVIEIVPATAVERSVWVAHENLIRQFIYGGAREAGLKPARKFADGMHWNFDYQSTFGGKKNLFRNFLADTLNHSELMTGALFEDAFNAAHNFDVGMSREWFTDTLNLYDAGKLSEGDFLAEVSQIFARHKQYIALMVRDYLIEGETPNARIELRFVRQTESAEEMNRTLNLFVKRMEFLEKTAGTVPLDGKTRIYGRTYGRGPVSRGFRYLRSSSSDVDDGILKFAAYVYESGLDFNDYQFALKESWRARVPALQTQIDELKTFLISERCNGLLKRPE